MMAISKGSSADFPSFTKIGPITLAHMTKVTKMAFNLGVRLKQVSVSNLSFNDR